MLVQQRYVILSFPVKAHAVAMHHLRGQPLAADRGPERPRQAMLRYRNLADRRAQFLQTGDGSANFLRDSRIQVRQLKTFGHNADL